MKCAKTLTVPHTGMAITIDLGGVMAGIPQQSRLRQRLSLLALHDVYAKPSPSWSGPLFRAAQREGGKMVITFDHAAGLTASSGELQGSPSPAPIKSSSGPKRRSPMAKSSSGATKCVNPRPCATHGRRNPNGNLVNAARLPASPFRTDDWK